MKINKKEVGRTLDVSFHDDGGDEYFVVVERVRYQVYGRNRWEEQRVSLSEEEISKLAISFQQIKETTKLNH